MSSGIPKLLTIPRGLLLVVPWACGLILMDLILSLLLPISIFFPTLVYNTSSFVAHLCWNWIQLIFEVCNGGEIAMSGDALPEGETAIVISNHVSWTDFYMIQALALRAGMLGRCRWFAKVELSEQEMAYFFSESTRYTPRKYEETKTWCRQNDKPIPKHLLYPRTKGFVTTVQHLRMAKHVKAVYDMTIAYSHHNKFLEAPTVWESLSCGDLSGKRGYKFHVHAQRYLLADLPETDEELSNWLETRWIEKGEFLEAKREEWARACDENKHKN
ncbi:hypothetical protein B7494_g6784 [Chlorociboria aeruginascens]|nr:hypothetical protein B7494_g6784 [Chlorociboria aeruginascens]